MVKLRPYKCDSCKKAYRARQDLGKHERLFHSTANDAIVGLKQTIHSTKSILNNAFLSHLPKTPSKVQPILNEHNFAIFVNLQTIGTNPTLMSNDPVLLNTALTNFGMFL